jgi:hypothetical protein
VGLRAQERWRIRAVLQATPLKKMIMSANRQIGKSATGNPIDNRQSQSTTDNRNRQPTISIDKPTISISNRQSKSRQSAACNRQ